MERIDIQPCRWLAGLTVSFLIELTPVSVGINARTPPIEVQRLVVTGVRQFFPALGQIVNWLDQKSETASERGGGMDRAIARRILNANLNAS
jgi:hypothetical protein